MTDIADDLIERVRAASGADMELDAMIVRALVSATEADLHLHYGISAYYYTAILAAILTAKQHEANNEPL